MAVTVDPNAVLVANITSFSSLEQALWSQFASQTVQLFAVILGIIYYKITHAENVLLQTEQTAVFKALTPLSTSGSENMSPPSARTTTSTNAVAGSSGGEPAKTSPTPS